MAEILIFILLLLILVNILPDLPRKIGKTLGKIRTDIIDGYKEQVGDNSDKNNDKGE